MTKAERMQELKMEAEQLTGMPKDGPGKLVWGEGPLNAALAIVGEAPGLEEEMAESPFVGPAGRLLNAEIALAGVSRSQLYITNVIKCRITKPGTSANRRPTVQELGQWSSLLKRELQVISPSVILCLGTTAAKALLDRSKLITALRHTSFTSEDGCMVYVTYHPAYLLRWGNLDSNARYMQFK